MEVEEQADTVTADGQSRVGAPTSPTADLSGAGLLADNASAAGPRLPEVVNTENAETAVASVLSDVVAAALPVHEEMQQQDGAAEQDDDVEISVARSEMASGNQNAAGLDEVMQLSPPAANVEIGDVELRASGGEAPEPATEEQDDDEQGDTDSAALEEEPFQEELFGYAEMDDGGNRSQETDGDHDEQDVDALDGEWGAGMGDVYVMEAFPEEDDDDNDSNEAQPNGIIDPSLLGDEVNYDDALSSALRELIAQRTRGEGNNAGMQRDNFMQRVRRALFSIEHNRMRNRDDGGDHEVEVPEEEPENPVRFDTNLPAEHSYLGANMNRVSGVNYLEVGQQYHMMLFMHQYILFPGEVLPFMISGSIIESDIDAQNGLLFGVCFPVLCNSEQDENYYGVTCQIYEKGTDPRGNTLIKSRALQRFVTMGNEFSGPLQFIAAHPQLKSYGYVKILPEIYLPEPLRCINMGSLNRFRDNESMRPMYRRYQAASTPWPAHVYEYYSISSIIEKARTQLAQHKIDTMPTDVTQLSFWLVRNLHLSENLTKKIFMTDSVNIRMKLISSTFKEDAMFTCRYCGNRIANCRELFAMSKHGVQTQYCNSAGYIHETNTVYQLLPDAISYSGVPSAEFSWFPGYQWHIIVCKICSRHIGWKFKALEPNLVPMSFFGISSSSVRISARARPPPHHHAVVVHSLQLARREMQ